VSKNIVGISVLYFWRLFWLVWRVL